MEWTDGMLYPVLHRLERLGHVEARWRVAENGRRRKYYRITPRGLAQLAEERRQWEAVEDTLKGIWQMLCVRVQAGRPCFAPPRPPSTPRALFYPILANHGASSVPQPQGA